MIRISIVIAAVPLLCVSQISSHAGNEPALRVTGIAQSLPSGWGGQSTLVLAHLPSLPAGTAPVSVVPPAQPGSVAVPGPGVAAAPAPAIQLGETPFNGTPYLGVYDRSVPGTALRYVTPDELARRTLFFPAFPQSPIQSDLAPDEVILDCVMPEEPKGAARLAMVPRARVPSGPEAPNRDGDAK